MQNPNQFFENYLIKLQKEGKIKSISEKETKEAFERISEKLEPLNFESRIKQIGSEANSINIIFNC